MSEHQAYSDACTERGYTILGGEELGFSKNALTVRPDGSITEGPFAETAEQLGGFYLVTAPSREAVLKHAMLLPEYTIEVREIMQM